MIQLKKLSSHKYEETLRNPFIEGDDHNLFSLMTTNESGQRAKHSPLRLVNQPPKKKAVQPSEHEEIIETRSRRNTYRQSYPQQFKQQTFMPKYYFYRSYDILDLTYSLIDANISLKLLATLFVIQIVIRYFSILCYIYVMIATNFEFWQWILILFATYLFYFVCIVKISLKFPQTKSQYILKQSFNSLEENQNLQFFQVIDARKLGLSMLRGITPPELSFLYIKDLKKSVKSFQIYLIINFIYNSIEAIIYYPFFLIYTIMVYYKNVLSELGWVFDVSYLSIVLTEVIFLGLCTYLIVHGCTKKGYWNEKDKINTD